MIGPAIAIAAALTLVRSGWLHRRHPNRLADALVAQGVWPTPVRTAIVRLLPPTEVAIGVLLVGSVGWDLAPVLVGSVTLGLGLAFGSVLVVLLARDSNAPCGCSAGDAPVHPSALLRPLLLTAAGLLLVTTTLSSLPAAGDAAAVAALAGACGAALVDLLVETLAAGPAVRHGGKKRHAPPSPSTAAWAKAR